MMENDSLKESVAIIRRPINSIQKTGLERYADTMSSFLDDADYVAVEADLTLDKGFVHFIKHGICSPLKKIRRMGKFETYHAMDELCAFVFLFVRGYKVMTIHHVAEREHSSRIFYFIWSSLTKFGFKKSDKIIAISQQTYDCAIRFGADKDKLVLIPSPISSVFNITGEPKEKIVGCVGQLSYRKNMSASVYAFKQMISHEGAHDWKMIICGKGPDYDNLMDLISNEGLEGRVQIISGLSDLELVSFYNRCSLFFNTSLYEGLGLTPMEAQKCGTPTFHLEYASLPKEVIAGSISCKTPEDMGNKAWDLIHSSEYDLVCKKSKAFADEFGVAVSEKFRKILNLSDDSHV